MTLATRLPPHRLVLVDAVTCGAMGTFLTLGADALGSLTRIPPTLLLYAGLSLFPVAAFMTVVAMRPAIQPAAMGLIIAGNGLWVAGSLMLVLTGWIAPNPLGTAFIVAQALVVAVLAFFEHRALRDGLMQPRTS